MKFELNWSGKQYAKKESYTQSEFSLIPDKNDSKNWDTTQNLYIEGDNLEVLKVLQNSYQNRVKIIYIDPPYNTGNDFVYKDSYKDDIENYLSISGQKNEVGNRINVNIDTNGRYHVDWLNMMYPRLRLARNLLADDGVIFISIANEEQANLKKICDEIFGEENFIETFIWTKTSTPPSLSTKSRKTVEYILCYEKYRNNNKYRGELLANGDVPLLNSGNSIKVLNFPIGKIKFNIEDGIYEKGIYEKVELLDELIVENGTNKNAVKLAGEFRWTQEKLDEEIKDGTYFLIKSNKFSIRFQRGLREDDYKTPTNFISGKQIEVELNSSENIGTNETAGKELSNLGLKSIFDYAKPTSLIKYLIKFVTEKDDIVLDFFSGSATTAHSVMSMNLEDGGNRKFIMVQIPQLTIGESKYKNICEIGKERIKRAGDKITEENKDKEGIEDLDIGFKVFRLKNKNELKEEEILYELILAYGFDLNTEIIKLNNNLYKINNLEVEIKNNKIIKIKEI